MTFVTDRPQTARPRRSALTVPGGEPRMLAKSDSLLADQLVYDLEDAVAEGRKETALDNVVDTLTNRTAAAGVRSVRVNGLASGRTHRDLVGLVSGAGAVLDTVVVPKVSDAGHLAFVDHLLTQLEVEYDLPVGGIGVEAQIEDASGLLELGEITRVTPRLEALTYGPGDLAGELGLPVFTIGGHHPHYPGDHWHHVHATLVLHARRAGVQAIAGPYVEIEDRSGFEDLALRTRGLGFDGTWVVHPTQIEIANRIFGLSQAAFDRANDLLDAYAHATQQEGRGAVMFGAEMIDEANRRQAEKLRTRGLAQGLAVRSTPENVPFAARSAWRKERFEDYY